MACGTIVTSYPTIAVLEYVFSSTLCILFECGGKNTELGIRVSRLCYPAFWAIWALLNHLGSSFISLADVEKVMPCGMLPMGDVKDLKLLCI